MENLGITFKTTAAQASFSNGINERHNAILKDILNKLRLDDEHKSTSAEILLSYAIFAKNCLVDNLGFSPHQRVYGRNPNIPNLNSKNICHTNQDYESDHVREHLNLLHKSRIAYMKAENSDRIKRALSARIFSSDGPFFYGEKVFYWKESANKNACGWKGPGTVVGTEGKVVIVRHGSFINRCHETKVRRVSEGEALSDENVKSETVLKSCRPNESMLLPVQMHSSGVKDDMVVDNSSVEINNNIDQTEKEAVITSNQAASGQPNNIVPETPVDVVPETSNDKNQVCSNEGGAEGVVEGRTLRPRSSIKPPARYDEVYIISEGDAKQKAMMKELDSWKAHDVYKEVDRSEANNNIITTRWIFTDKFDENRVKFIKARLVIRGFQDREKDDILSESPTANTDSLKTKQQLIIL